MTDVKALLSRDAACLDRWLNEYFDRCQAVATTPYLVRAMRYSALNGGKRLRASLVLSAARMAKQLSGLPAACASPEAVAASVELIHAYSLIHDDLPAMDDSELRRGIAANHIAFDEATAILAGDALQTEAFSILSTPELCDSASMQLKLIQLLSKASGVQGMAGGQMLDLAAAEQPFDLAQTRHMQDLKTGALIKAAAVMGVVAGGGTSAVEQATGCYAAALGFAFQIADDLLDFNADSSTLGKPSGRDAAQGKASLVTLHGLEEAREMAAELIAEAVEHLRPFGKTAHELTALAYFAIDRDH
jgi:farnesyl diphosphate synthase